MNTEEKMFRLLSECRDFVAGCVGSSYHDTDKEDEEFLGRIDRELAEIEWSSSRQGQGFGPHGSGGDGAKYRACPACRGLKEPNNEFVSEAVGHQPGCYIARVLGRPTRSLQAGEQGKMAL